MKRYIYGMAFPKAEATRRAGYYAQDIMEHLIKILVYHEERPDDVSHWISEIAAWLSYVDHIKIKPTSRSLKENEVLNNTFAPMGDTLEDYIMSLDMFQTDNKKGKFNYDDKGSYPYVKPDASTGSDLMAVCYEIRKTITPLICYKEDHSKQQFVEILTTILQKYI